MEINNSKVKKIFEKNAKNARGIYFWEAEYLKRKFLAESNGLDIILKDYLLEVKKHLHENILSMHKDKKVNYEKFEIKAMQMEYYYRLAGDKEVVFAHPETGFDLRGLLRDHSFPEYIEKMLEVMYIVSYNYHYFVDDLLSPWDMNELAPYVLENDSLPDPPILHFHKDLTPEIDEEVYRSGFAFPRANKIDVLLNMKKFSSSYVALVDFLHPNFDYKNVLECFKKQLCFLIYCHKENNNIQLTEDELKDLVNTLKSDAGKGFGSGYSCSRAVGLLVWDCRFASKTKESRQKSYSIIKNSSYKMHYDVDNLLPDSANLKRLNRIYKTTEKCIKAGKVLKIQQSFKGDDGKI